MKEQRMSKEPVLENSKPTAVQFNLLTGQIEPCSVYEPRHVSNLAEMFFDQAEAQRIIAEGDPLVYEIRHTHFATRNSDMALGVSTIYSGTIGGEYYMTKGHVHERDDQPEIYYCVRGNGLLLMDDLNGDFQATPFNAGTIVHIPPQYAHRVINTGNDLLVFVSAFHLAAGHNYAQVKEKGFAYRICEVDGQPSLIKNLTPTR
jgi:glucose-6-phosphate isomerase, archaeal